MLKRGLILLTGLFALGACDSTDPEGDTRLSILLTDLPGDVTQAVVTIESIFSTRAASSPPSCIRTSGPYWRVIAERGHGISHR